MTCRVHQERFSDYLEGALSLPLRRELSAHLETCEECRSLLDSLEEVMRILAAAREAEQEPGNLTELVLARTRPALETSRKAWIELESGGSVFRSVAAGLAAAAVLATVLLVRQPAALSGWSRAISQKAHQGYSFGVRTYYRASEWIEDLQVLRMTVGVAFEDRLDRLNERLRDLEDARRKDEADETSRSEERLPEAKLSLRAHPKTTRSFL